MSQLQVEAGASVRSSLFELWFGGLGRCVGPVTCDWLWEHSSGTPRSELLRSLWLETSQVFLEELIHDVGATGRGRSGAGV